MKQSGAISRLRTDLPTYLVGLSLRLRVGAMELERLSRKEGQPGVVLRDEIVEVGKSLFRVADCLVTVSGGFCPSCRSAMVAEHISVFPFHTVVRVYRGRCGRRKASGASEAGHARPGRRASGTRTTG